MSLEEVKEAQSKNKLRKNRSISEAIVETSEFTQLAL
jgi:hypothetical protein